MSEEWTKEDQETWGSQEDRDNAFAEIQAEDNAREKRISEVLTEIEQLKGKEFVEAILEICEGSTITDMEFVKESSGRRQPCDDIQGCEMYVYQSSVGDSGDSFSGNMYWKLGEENFLQVGYWC